MHLPYLRELDDRFAVAARCDVSPATLDAVGVRYGVPAHARFLDYRALCASDLVDAVLVCPSGSQAPAAAHFAVAGGGMASPARGADQAGVLLEPVPGAAAA